MSEQKKKANVNNIVAADIQKQRAEWRRKGWSVPDLRGGKQSWFSLVKKLVELVGSGQANDLDAFPDINVISSSQPWRSYAPFLRGIGLVNNQAGALCLSEVGIKFRANPSKRQLANLIQDRVRLFAEALELVAAAPATVEEINEQLCVNYGLSWSNLSNT